MSQEITNGENKPQEEFASLDELENEREQSTPEDNTPDVDEQASPDLPEKYQNKSIEDIVKMHQEAEKEISRKGQELGELRKHADAFIQRELEKPTGTEETQSTEISFDDLVKDPSSTIRSIVESDVAEIKDTLAKKDREEAQIRFYEKYPNSNNLLNDDKFVSWVQQSPLRMKLLEQGNAFDFDAAGELMELYGMHAGEATVDQQVIDDKAKQHATSKAKGGSGVSSKKVYKRADIIELQMKDNKRYQALLPEIKKAYQEGRVR